LSRAWIVCCSALHFFLYEIYICIDFSQLLCFLLRVEIRRVVCEGTVSQRGSSSSWSGSWI
jgi:hypothetical protein